MAWHEPFDYTCDQPVGDMEDRTGEILDGRYRLESLLGEGGMGAVYTGSHLVTGRKVAVKFLLPELADNTEAVGRFYREARAATAIGSEHICEVLDMRPPEEGSPYLVMEYLDGETLKERLQRGQMPLEEAVNAMLQVCEALYAAHKAGIVHRDIKPENVFLVAKEGRPPLVKLLDFGISKFSDKGGEDHSLTRTGTVLGTPYYMSPEQASGERTVGPLSDIYAVGVMLYEVFTGTVPYDAESFSALVVKIVTETPLHPCQRNPNLPQAMGDLVMKAMARQSQVRFSSAKELAEAIRAVAQGQQIQFNSMGSGDASFEAVSLQSSSGVTALPRTQIYADGASSASGVVGSGTSQTPMTLSRTGEQQRPKTWLFVGGGAIVALLLIAGVGGVFIVPSLLEDDAPPPPVVRPTPPTPPTPPVNPALASANPAAVPTPTAQPGADAGAESAEASPAADAGPENITVTFAITPTSAEVFLDDRPVEGGPTGEIEIPADGETHVVRATARGHQEQRHEFQATEDQRIALELPRARRGRRQQGGRTGRNPQNQGSRNPVGVYTPAGW